MKLLTFLAALGLLFAAPVHAAPPRDLSACAPAADAGACISAVITAPGRYDCGDGLTYTVLTPIRVTQKSVTLQGACTLQLGAADQYVVWASDGADDFHLLDLQITNPSGFGQSNPAVFSTSGAVFISGRVNGCSVERVRIEGLIFGIMRQGYDMTHVSGGCAFNNNLISVRPWNFSGATWTNDCITIYNGVSGDQASGNVCVIYTAPGVFTNLTGTAFTYARVGIGTDVGSTNVTLAGNTVGQGFGTSMYIDSPGVLALSNNLYPGYGATLMLASGTARDNTIRGPTNPCATIFCGAVTMTGGGTLEGGTITGTNGAIDAIVVQNSGSGPIAIRGVQIRGLWANGVGGGHGNAGLIPQDFTSQGVSWGGTGLKLYNFGMVSATASASISADTQAPGLTFSQALVGWPLNNGRINGVDWRGASGNTVTLFPYSGSVVITGSNLANPTPANAAVIVAGATAPQPLVVQGNDLTGPTKAVLINSAGAAFGTAQIVSGNINNTTGTW